MSWRVREAFEREKVSLSARPPAIREWVERRFGSEGTKVFLELGSHCGTDTAWMAALEGVRIHAFEPDPRNHQVARANVIPHRAAIADRDGRAPFILSQLGWGQEWTHSSSLKTPKNHLSRFPVTFGETIEVETVTLDSFHRKQGLGDIDFIWADIQGAEREMIRGGQECLARTRYLFTEYSDDELRGPGNTTRNPRHAAWIPRPRTLARRHPPRKPEVRRLIDRRAHRIPRLSVRAAGFGLNEAETVGGTAPRRDQFQRGKTNALAAAKKQRGFWAPPARNLGFEPVYHFAELNTEVGHQNTRNQSTT